jgi:GNAT superfamily N-acetyltransferase
MIRPATRDDVPAIARVQVASWHGVYQGLIPDEVIDGITVERRIAQWTAFFQRADDDEALIVADHEGSVVGLASLGVSRDDDFDGARVGEVRAIYVDPDHWGHGHGRELMVGVEDWLRRHDFAEAMLWVLEANRRARHFYDAAGWAVDGASKIEDIFGAAVPEVRYRVHLRADNAV